jgi:hypothetical protein
MIDMILAAQAPVLITQQRGETHPSSQVNDVFVGSNNQQAFKQFFAIPFGPDDVFQRPLFLLIEVIEFQSKATA